MIGTSSSDAADSVTTVDDVNIPPLREKYDVFISFRGEDTRLTFTSHLHAALRGKKIETYIDYRLERGDEIGPALLEAIEKSRLSVIIFSKNYASSTWCLKELVHILKCKKNGQMVVPIFYDISPSDVRKQKRSYADAFAQHENREDTKDKVIGWKAALVEATDLSGFDYSDKKRFCRTEADFIEEVVEDISTKLKRKTSDDLRGKFGIQSRIEQVESLLSIIDWQGVRTVGIWGMGGIGKTTLAQAVFKRLSSNFEAACFLNNVREKSEQIDGADQLKETLLREILKEENLSIDSTSVKERLSRTKVLIVFDDVSDSRQIKDLAGDNLRYGNGSGIIVTSRERSVLMKAVSDEKYIHEVKKMKTDDALQLFQFHAFKDNSPREEYTELSARAVKYAGGIPLALEVLGSLLFPCENEQEWEDVLSTLRNYPNEEIQNTFRVTYNRLGRNAQGVFLDIACFYKGTRIEDVKKMVDFGQLHGGSCAADGIRVLRDRSLISIDSKRETIDMHDLVQEMGRTIVREQCIEEPGRRSRLFIGKDICHVLKNKTGTEKVQAIFFEWLMIEERAIADFKKMYNMRLLSVTHSAWCGFQTLETVSLPNSLRYLFLGQYHLKSLPPEFSLENLVELHMPDNQVEQLWNGGQNPINLKVLNLHSSLCLTALPNLSRSRNIKHMDLSRCRSLVEIPQYLKNLDKLTYLDLSQCKSLKYLPKMPGNIEFLSLKGSGIKELPSSVWSHEKISYLDISKCEKLKELPSNTCKLKVSGAFSLKGCSSLSKFWELPYKLTYLDLSQCKSLEYLPEMPGNIESLSLKGSGIKELPSSVWCHEKISSLDISYCKKLKELPSNTCKLKVSGTFSLEGCSSLSEFWELPRGIGKLDFSRTKIEVLPTSSMECLSCLTKLKLWKCKKLASLPPSICKLKSLEELDVDSCSELEVVPSSIYKLTNIKTLSVTSCRKLRNFPQPDGSVGLPSLEVLDLCFSSILEIPEALICSTSLREINLRGTRIRSVPLSIKQASQLSDLCLMECKSLASLPELPVTRLFHARGCKSLKRVSSSRTAITQCWNRYELLREQLDFLNCHLLGDNAKSNIMVDAQLRIMQVAIASSKLREKEEEEEEDDDDDADEDDDHEYYSYWPLVSIVCPGKEIPNWFSYQSEESSVVIELRQDWFRTGLLGFALAVVVSWELNCQLNWMVRASFNVKFKGESHEMFTSEFDIRQASWKLNDYCYGQHHVYLWNEAFKSEVVAKKCSPDFCNLANDASVEFCLVDEDSGEPTSYMKVEKCGICPLYVEDAERFKYGHVIVRGITEAKRASSCIEMALAVVPGESKEEEEEEERRHDNFEANEPETNGSGDESEEEASGSGDESEEKASGSRIDNNADLLVRQSYRDTSLMDLKQMHIKSLKPTSHAVPRPYYFSPRYNVEF